MRCGRWLRAAAPAALLLAVLGLGPAAAQGPSLTGPLRASPLPAAAPAMIPSSTFPTETRPGVLFLASLVLPGSGQGLQGQGRWVLYAALEVWSWARYADLRLHGDALAAEYRALALDVARRVGTGTRPGDFHYYESLAKPQYPASGAFDRDPDLPGIQPETTPFTFNAEIWELARGIYLPGGVVDPASPAYADAIRYYEERAIRPEFAWSWGANGLEQEVYRELIRDSDDARRSATSTLGIILANHLVSAIDALVTARLRAEGEHPPARLRGALEPTRDGVRWRLSVHIPLPGS